MEEDEELGEANLSRSGCSEVMKVVEREQIARTSKPKHKQRGNSVICDSKLLNSERESLPVDLRSFSRSQRLNRVDSSP
jgi:hypothetical protein